MVQVRFKKINNSELSSLDIIEGQLIFTQDTKKLYLDKDSTHRIQIEGLDLAAGTGISVDGMTITNAGVRNILTGTNSGTIKVNTNGTDAEVAVAGLKGLAYKDNIAASNITSGEVSVERGGTGVSSFTSGQVLVGNGTSALTTKAIDTTSGGTSSSANLITSGAVYAGLATKLDTTLKGANNGLAELDINGLVPSSQLPSYVDDVIEGYYYNSKFYKESAHTTEIPGTTGKIYIDLSTEKTYRWSGSVFVIISETLALGETSSTAYRGDRGKIAYDHATDANRLTTAQTSGLYKIATTTEGHVASATAVEKADITALGIPAQDTTYENKTAASGGTDVSLVTTGDKYTWNNKIDSSALTNYVQNTDYADSNTAGVIKTYVDTNFYVNSSGQPYAPQRTYSQYAGDAVNSFVSKGTLENVITGKSLLVPSDITITPVQQSGATVGTIQVGNGSAITLYAPQPGAVSTELAGAQQTYYLTGVKETVATQGSQIYNTRMSNTYTGLKYQTSTSNAGGSLYVDNREVTLGLYYEIA